MRHDVPRIRDARQLVPQICRERCECSLRGCMETTHGGKAFCRKHVLRQPYARLILRKARASVRAGRPKR